MEVRSFSCNLNIHYSIPEYIWNLVTEVYKAMPEWKGFIDGLPY